jgi:KUP system potassium uptake protein
LNDYVPLITQLSEDVTIPKYSTHLIYLASSQQRDEIETKVIYSILQKQPKRADTYWFLHVDVMDEPYTMKYEVIEFVKSKIIRINFKLGFRVEQRINVMFRQVVQDLVTKGEVDIISRYYSLNQKNIVGDFRFVVIEKYLSNENILKAYEKLILNAYDVLRKFGMSEGKEFGLDASSVTVEKVPLIINPVGSIPIKRVE